MFSSAHRVSPSLLSTTSYKRPAPTTAQQLPEEKRKKIDDVININTIPHSQVNVTNTKILYILGQVFDSRINIAELYNSIISIDTIDKELIQTYLWMMLFRIINKVTFPDNFNDLKQFFKTIFIDTGVIPSITTTDPRRLQEIFNNIFDEEIFDLCKRIMFNALMKNVAYPETILSRIGSFNTENVILAAENNFFMICYFLTSSTAPQNFENFQSSLVKYNVNLASKPSLSAPKSNQIQVSLYSKTETLIFTDKGVTEILKLKDIFYNTPVPYLIERHLNSINITDIEFNLYKKMFEYIKNDLSNIITTLMPIRDYDGKILSNEPRIQITVKDIYIADPSSKNNDMIKIHSRSHFYELIKDIFITPPPYTLRIINLFQYAILEKIKSSSIVNDIIFTKLFTLAFSSKYQQIPAIIKLQEVILDNRGYISLNLHSFFLFTTLCLTNPREVFNKLSFTKTERNTINKYITCLEDDSIRSRVLNSIRRLDLNIEGLISVPSSNSFAMEFFNAFAYKKPLDYTDDSRCLYPTCIKICIEILAGVSSSRLAEIRSNLFSNHSTIPQENIRPLQEAFNAKFS